MKLTAPPTPKPKVDETAGTATTQAFNRKMRLIRTLEAMAQDANPDPQDAIDAFMVYVNDKYISHLTRKIDFK